MTDLPPPLAAIETFAQHRVTAERRRLLAEAWRAGYRNIAELRRLSGLSRQTIYDDLEAMNIDPKDRDAPIVPALPLRAAAAEPSIVGELQHAAFAAITARTYRVDEGLDLNDINPHTAGLPVHALAGLFTAIPGRRMEEPRTDGLSGLRIHISVSAEDTHVAALCDWVAWELRRLGAEAEAARFERLATRPADPVYYLYTPATLDTPLLYRRGDDRAWDARGRLRRRFRSDARQWHFGAWDPSEKLLWTNPPTAAELDPDPEVRRGALAHLSPEDQAALAHQLLATWTPDEVLSYPEGAEDILASLSPELRHYLNLDDAPA